MFFMMTSLSMLAPAMAYDNGPQVIGCDYKFGKTEGTSKCLIVGSGMNQGISWLVFQVEKKRFRYDDSSPTKIERINKSGNVIATYKVENSSGQCRPGGRTADIYAFSNNDRVCLYWQ